MRKINRRIWGLLFGLSFFGLGVAGEKVDFSVETHVGGFSGLMQEHVLDSVNNSGRNFYNISRLDWDIPFVLTAGNTLNLDLSKGFHFDLGYKTNVYALPGIMEDYDWLDPTSSEILTNYSKHTNLISNYLDISFTFGYNFTLPAKLTITPLVAFEYETIACSGIDGTYKYRKGTGIISNPYYWEEGVFEGKVISYSQSFFAMKTGFNFGVQTIPHFNFDLGAFIIPYLTLTGLDTHHLRRICFKDTMFDGFCVQSNLGIGFSINEHHILGLRGNIEYIPLVVGSTQQKPESGTYWYTIEGYGGGNRFFWGGELYYTFKL